MTSFGALQAGRLCDAMDMYGEPAVYLLHLLRRHPTGLIGVVGPAAAGKTQLVLKWCPPSVAIYHIDSRFIGTSADRVNLLATKPEQADGRNQFNWWDWDRIEQDVKELPRPAVVEGAFLGPPALVSQFDAILWLECPDKVRLDRLLIRDAHKRTAAEIYERFALTERAEAAYYQQLRTWAAEKIVCVSS